MKRKALRSDLEWKVTFMSKQRCLNDMKPGERAQVAALRSTGSMRRRLLDLGLVENTTVECLGSAPGGDPTAFLIRGAVIALRAEDCRGVLLRGERGAGQWA